MAIVSTLDAAGTRSSLRRRPGAHTHITHTQPLLHLPGMVSSPSADQPPTGNAVWCRCQDSRAVKKRDFWLSKAKSLWLQKVKESKSLRLADWWVTLKSSVIAAWLSFALFLKIVAVLFILKDVLFFPPHIFHQNPTLWKSNSTVSTLYKFVTCFFFL